MPSTSPRFIIYSPYLLIAQARKPIVRYHGAMISHLTGIPLTRDDHAAIIDVSGIGYRVHTTSPVLESIRPDSREPMSFWTHLAVRENALDLYGFPDRDECAFFEMLITVSGIGPKTALAILNLAPAATLRRAVQSGETAYLTRVSGIGRKNAEKIVLELRDKLGPIESGALDADSLDALLALGYSAHDARTALRSVPEETTDTPSRVKEALKALGAR